MKTGVFYHPLFHQKLWPIIADKFRDFPGAMEHILALPNVELFEPAEVSEDLMLTVHTPQFIDSLREKWYSRGAFLSAGGCVEATEKMLSGELRNSFVFSVAAGHHAGPSYAWGGTYLSCSGPAVANLRKKFGNQVKVAIIDTDAHHGDGTRAIFSGDSQTLHGCFCSQNIREEEGKKFCVNVGGRCGDEKYLDFIRSHFIPAAEEFAPDIIIYLMGYDTCQGDYGDQGLTPSFFPQAVKELKELAERVCQGKISIFSMGGARPDYASTIIPEVIKVLAD